MADYDMYSDVKPVFGTAAGVALDGTASKTAAVDTKGWHSVTGLLTTTTAIQYGNMTLSFEDSDDNVTFGAVPADQTLFRKPTPLTTTSQVFWAGYIGKKRYVKFKAQTVAGTELGQLTTVLGHPAAAPHDQAALEG